MEYRPIPIATRRGCMHNIPVSNGQTTVSYNAAASRSGMKWPHSSSQPNKMMHVPQAPMMVPVNTGGLILNSADALQQHVSVESSQMIGVVADDPHELRPTHQTSSKSTTSCRPLTLIILTTVGLALLTIAVALPMTASWAQSRSAFVRSTSIEEHDGSDVKTTLGQSSESNQLRPGYGVAAAAMSSLASISSLLTNPETPTASTPSSEASHMPPPPPPAQSESTERSRPQRDVQNSEAQTQTVGSVGSVTHSIQIAEEVLAAVSADTVCEEVLNVVRFRTGLTNVLFKRSSLPMHQLVKLDRPIMISANGMISPYYSNIRFSNLTAHKMYRNLAGCSRDVPLAPEQIKNLTCASPGISFRLTCAHADSEETVQCAFRASAGCVSSAESRVQSSTSYNRMRSDWVLWCSVTTLL